FTYLFLGAAVEGPTGDAEAAAVSGVCVCADGDARAGAGDAGPRGGTARGFQWGANAAARGRDRGIEEGSYVRDAGRATSFFDGWATGSREERAAGWNGR